MPLKVPRFGWLLASALALSLGSGCATRRVSFAPIDTTAVRVSGAADTVITGHYQRAGERVDFTAKLPFSLTETRLSEVEIRRVRPADDFTVRASKGGVEVGGVTSAGLQGFRLLVGQGLELQAIWK